MKTKRMAPIIIGGILGIGAAVSACCVIQRLQKIISTKEKRIAEQEDIIDQNTHMIENLEIVIERDKEIIEAQAVKIEILEGTLGHRDAPESDGNHPSVPEESSEEPVQSKKGKRISSEYIFQYDSNLSLVAKYESTSEACRIVGLKYPSSIRKVLRGQAYTAAGYFWSKGSRPLKKFPDKWIELSQNAKNEK